MGLPRIYYPFSLKKSEQVALNAKAKKHLSTVLRLQIGDEFILFNGENKNKEYHAVIRGNKPFAAEVIKEQEVTRESPLKIHLGQGISRGEKMDYTIQKAVELGVSEITPLFTEFCNVKLNGDRLEKRQEHWQKVAIAAAEQSGRTSVPIIHPSQILTRWQPEKSTVSLICDPQADKLLTHLNGENWGSVTLIVGPEGGLSKAEIALMVTQGFQPISLAANITH